MNHHRIRNALRLVRPLGLCTLAVGLAALTGYAAALEILYRPLPGGPATHPLTGLAAVLLGIAVTLRHSRLATTLAGTALVIAAARLLEILAGTDLLMATTPFRDTLLAERAAGHSVNMGWNTATMFLLTSAALLAHRRAVVSQLLASLAIALPLVSITGYAYGMAGFYGQMSLTTVSLGLPLTLATLLRSAHRGILRAVLSPFIGGRIARIQILLGYLGPFVIGLVTLHATEVVAHHLFGLFVVATSLFITWLVVLSAVVQDRLDRKRRAAERRLAIAASHDALTGLPNRRSFVELADKERARAIRTGQPYALLMIDVDHFKAVNDRAGHMIGDQVLRLIADALRTELRGGDTAARFGGEEFVVVLPMTSVEQAHAVAERIRRAVQGLRLADLPGEVVPITISAGATVLAGQEQLEATLARADAALYSAKELGRNRTEIRVPPVLVAA